MKKIKETNAHAGNMAMRYAADVEKAAQTGKLEYTYPETGMVSAHDALQSWAYKIREKAYFCMRSSFGSAIVEINLHSALPEKDSHPVQW